MSKLRLIISSIVLQTMPVFASYDGRMADDPYHRSPTWLYVVIGGFLIYAVVNGIRKRLSDSSRRKNSQNQSSIKSSGIKTAKSKDYQEFGHYWDECPDCKGRGYVRGQEVFYSFCAPQTVICEVCKGFQHKLNDDAKGLYKEMEKALVTEKNIRVIERENGKSESENPFERASITTLLSLYPETKHLVKTKELRSEQLRRKITETVKSLPYCSHCSAKGYHAVEMDNETGRAFAQVPCKRCNGCGKLYYS